MPFVSCQGVSKYFSARPLFKNITMGFEPEERLGLIGPNGSGKSTLLRILAGQETPDEGEISRRRNLRLVYVPQDDDFASEQTVEEVLYATLAGETLEEYERDAIVGMALTQWSFPQSAQTVGTLSGGWKRRLALARALTQRPDLLLLDEPTNHLDIEGILRLESLLRNAAFAYVVVSHDRFFLENVADRILELNRAYPDGYLSADGTYSDFLAKKEEFLAAQAHQQQALEVKVKREIEWLRRSAPARTTKANARIQQAERLIGELDEVKFRNAQDKTVTIDFTATGRKTKELLVAKEVAKSRGGRALFSGVQSVLSPGVKLGLLGPNGSGKTTLLRLLTGDDTPDKGVIERAEGLRIVFFDQNREQLDTKLSLRRALSPHSDTVIYRDRPLHISAWAKRFLFRAEQLDMPVENLSGGEQARILIANLMLRPADLLLLDEPTNDLDIPSLEVLEDCLEEFPGALVLVTHDRYMLDNVSTQLLALDGNGGAHYFASYAQWERTAAQRATEETTSKPKKESPPAPRPTRRMTSQELREWNNMEATILTAEEAAATIQQEMNSPAVASDSTQLQAKWDALQAAQERIAQLYARWEELETIRNNQ